MAEEKIQKATILVVDDENLLRWSLKEHLTPKYNIILAERGEEALGYLKNGRNIDLLITDIRMDAMDGVTLIELARSYRPALDAMIMTAYDSEENIKRAKRAGVLRIITKPFAVEELEVAIEETLEG